MVLVVSGSQLAGGLRKKQRPKDRRLEKTHAISGGLVRDSTKKTNEPNANPGKRRLEYRHVYVYIYICIYIYIHIYIFFYLYLYARFHAFQAQNPR